MNPRKILLIPGLLLLSGCGNPTEGTRQNRRLLDAVLTAVTTKNRKELDKDEVLIEKRYSDRRLSDKPYRAWKASIEKARSGDWSRAEEELYKYREADPFPR